MSKENKKTLGVYDRLGQKYIDNTIAHDEADPEKAKKKRAKLESLLHESFKELPEDGRVLEIGSGDGTVAAFLKGAGFNIIASDVAEVFLDSCRRNGLKPLKLNVVEDKLPDELAGALAWRVFVHFTKEDLEETLFKVYSALIPGGVFVFNVFNKEASGIDTQWEDFGEYHMGEKRFFAYYDKAYVDDLIEKAGFRIKQFFMQGGETGDKWLCYVVVKD